MKINKFHEHSHLWCFFWFFFVFSLTNRQQAINSFSPSVAIWRHRHGSTLAQVMARCQMAPSHYLNEWWLNSSDAGDGTFWLCGSIPCLMMPWLLKSPKHQQALYWLCRRDNMYFCSRDDFSYLGQAKSKIWFKLWIYIFYKFSNNSACQDLIIQWGPLTITWEQFHKRYPSHRLKITYLKFHSNFTMAKELTHWPLEAVAVI